MVFKGETSPGTQFYISTNRNDIPKNAILAGQVGGKDSYVGCYTVGDEFCAVHILAGDRKAYFTGSSHSKYTYAHTYLTICPKYTATWTSYQDGKVPDNAVKLGGNSTESFYIGRTVVDGGDTWVGKIVPSKGGLVHPVFEEEKFTTSYEVLSVFYDFTPGTSYYISQKLSEIPENAIIAGSTKEGHTVYVGAAYFTNFVPGRAIPANKQVYFPDSEGETTTEQMIYLTFNEGYMYKWITPPDSNVPANAAAVGSKVAEPNYVGRFKHDGEDCVGVISPTTASISYTHGGKSHTSSIFDYLIVSRFSPLSPEASLYHSTGPDDIPQNAIQVGPNSYVGFVKTKEESTPCLITVRDGLGWCHYGFNKKDYVITKLIFLTFNEGMTTNWVRMADGDVPDEAVRLGQNQEGQDYFVGRASMDSQACIGKICKTAGGCLVPKNGVEKMAKSYDVLVIGKVEEEVAEE